MKPKGARKKRKIWPSNDWTNLRVTSWSRIIKYVDVEMAVETRHALHGVRWPVTNPRTLRVEFSTDEAMEAVKKLAEEEDNAAQSQEKAAVNNDRKGWLSEKDVLKPTKKVRGLSYSRITVEGLVGAAFKRFVNIAIFMD
ncbi:unnamed protein product [Nesidiocoris tenuis]|uniref:Uncharacterized protein n=1 Tax=Nesidiocoris tenuis TaxID=355587 RepID=A0A6H5G1T5_9HEMI|nr:unnamed protein product [Nesidiocoris tenuis]CAA9996139.1 unnamed protein product [Nesidiocoris tenuis]